MRLGAITRRERVKNYRTYIALLWFLLSVLVLSTLNSEEAMAHHGDIPCNSGQNHCINNTTLSVCDRDEGAAFRNQDCEFGCSGKTCNPPPVCTLHSHCDPDEYCSGGNCIEKKDNGALCRTGIECLGEYCTGPPPTRGLCSCHPDNEDIEQVYSERDGGPYTPNVCAPNEKCVLTSSFYSECVERTECEPNDQGELIDITGKNCGNFLCDGRNICITQCDLTTGSEECRNNFICCEQDPDELKGSCQRSCLPLTEEDDEGDGGSTPKEDDVPSNRDLTRALNRFRAVPFEEVVCDDIADDLLSADFVGGTGTRQDPYLIANALQLARIENNLSARYKLVNDIDLKEDKVSWEVIETTGGPSRRPITTKRYVATKASFESPWNNWKPIGRYTTSQRPTNSLREATSYQNNHFLGVLDGDGHSICNLAVSEEFDERGRGRGNRKSLGLFGSTSSATIRDLKLEGHVSAEQGCLLNGASFFKTTLARVTLVGTVNAEDACGAMASTAQEVYVHLRTDGNSVPSIPDGDEGIQDRSINITGLAATSGRLLSSEDCVVFIEGNASELNRVSEIRFHNANIIKGTRTAQDCYGAGLVTYIESRNSGNHKYRFRSGGDFGPDSVTSYCDEDIGPHICQESNQEKTSSELKTPTSATGIYQDWNAENWCFGTDSQYPWLSWDTNGVCGEVCGNGEDDDFNGLTDKEDPACTEFDCANNIDDDNDGFVDVADADCREICDNNVDDNRNGLVDEVDNQCGLSLTATADEFVPGGEVRLTLTANDGDIFDGTKINICQQGCGQNGACKDSEGGGFLTSTPTTGVTDATASFTVELPLQCGNIRYTACVAANTKVRPNQASTVVRVGSVGEAALIEQTRNLRGDEAQRAETAECVGCDTTVVCTYANPDQCGGLEEGIDKSAVCTGDCVSNGVYYKNIDTYREEGKSNEASRSDVFSDLTHRNRVSRVRDGMRGNMP